VSSTVEIAPELEAKESRLKGILREYGAVAVAYSGGVDSSYLADVAHDELGAVARMVLADSPSIPRSEVRAATELAEARGWNLHVIHTQEFEDEEYAANDGRRWYRCKTELFTQMRAYAETNSVRVLAYGAIVDDLLDPTRLGAVAAKEHHVVAPLQEADLSKAEIRELSARRGLPTTGKASFACLSSRFPTGTRVTIEDVRKVEDAEEVLRGLDFHQFRARHHGDLCRIEIEPREFERVLDPATRDQILRGVREAGYRHVTLDLAGYRTGSTAD
jgi:pyridinium-3,5-biscarboxylic acid mononucleotide sulfurtransferase